LNDRARRLFAFIGCDVVGVSGIGDQDDGHAASVVEIRPRGHRRAYGCRDDLEGDLFLPDKITVDGNEIIVSPGVCRALNPYISHVQYLTALAGAKVFLEERLVVPGTYGMVWGTLDCGVHAGDDLHVVDLKFGKGVAVAPESPQLKLYALALAGFVRWVNAATRVTLTVCQPRIEGQPLRSHTMTLGDLWQWRDEVVEPAVRRIQMDDETENAGTHCRWCVRKGECRRSPPHQTHAASGVRRWAALTQELISTYCSAVSLNSNRGYRNGCHQHPMRHCRSPIFTARPRFEGQPAANCSLIFDPAAQKSSAFKALSRLR
jgi:hypothetical protein